MQINSYKNIYVYQCLLPSALEHNYEIKYGLQNILDITYTIMNYCEYAYYVIMFFLVKYENIV